jgi:uncharacterized protein YjbJ (UPF0337 family)
MKPPGCVPILTLPTVIREAIPVYPCANYSGIQRSETILPSLWPKKKQIHSKRKDASKPDCTMVRKSLVILREIPGTQSKSSLLKCNWYLEEKSACSTGIRIDIRNEKENKMTQDMLKGAWKELRGNIKKQWGKLTDDDLMEIDGNKDILIGKLQQRYGYSRDQAEKDYSTWMASQHYDRP